MSDNIIAELGRQCFSVASKLTQIYTMADLASIEPEFIYDRKDGIYYQFTYDNGRYRVGDQIHVPSWMTRSSGGLGDDEPEFDIFNISDEEIAELVAGDLYLPNLKQKEKEQVEIVWHKGGFTTAGAPVQLSIKRSFKEALVRRNTTIAMLEAEIAKLSSELDLLDKDSKEFEELYWEIEDLVRGVRSVPLLDKHDLRYKSFFKEEKRTINAVLFLLMDTSGSMDGEKKLLAKLGCYVLRYLLLKQYPKLEIVFIQHSTHAQECNETQFFNNPLNGGTILSSATTLELQIIKERYSPDKYNLFTLQVSDGENWAEDEVTWRNTVRDLAARSQLYSYVTVCGEEDFFGTEESFLINLDDSSDCLVTNHYVDTAGDWRAYFSEVFKK